MGQFREPSRPDEKVAGKKVVESVVSSTTLQDDNDLFLKLGAGEIWVFELVARVEPGTVSSAWKMNWTVPSGATGSFHPPDILAGDAVALGTTYAVTGASTANPKWYRSVGMIDNTSGVNGTLQLQWAQNASSASQLRFHIGSRLVSRKLL